MKRFRHLSTVFALFGALAAAQLPSYKQLKFPALREVKIPNPETFVLPNGMKVYLLEEHELPLISGIALVRTGNLFDPKDKIGLAQITGSVLRSGGTKSKTGDQIDLQLENIAASVESNIGEERGSLSFNALKENLDEVLDVYKDLMTNAEFRQQRLDLVKNQIKSSIARRNDDPHGIAGREFQGLIYGRENPYGWQAEYATIDNITRDDVTAFYKRYYFPANIMLAVYGDFNTAEMKAKLQKVFGDWNYQQPAVPKFPAFESKPAPGIFLADKPDVTQTFFQIGHIGGMLNDKDYPALEVATDILGSGFSSRLMHRIRTQLGYAYSISSRWGVGFMHPGVFTIAGSTKSASTADTIRVARQELDKLRTTEVTDEELKTAKDTVLNGFVFNFDTPAKTLNRLILYDYYGYPRDFIFQYQKAVSAVTKADVLRVAKQYFKPETFTIVAVGNPKDFGQPLTSLNLPVKPIDLTIPEPKAKPAAAASAGSMAQGKQLLEMAQKAVGGRDKLAAIKDWTRVADAALTTGGGQMKAKQTTQFIEPSTFRQDQVLPFGKVSVYSDGKSGWLASPQGVQPLPPPILQQVADESAHMLTHLLLASDANHTGNGMLQIGKVQLLVDEKTGMPLKAIYTAAGMGGPPQQLEESYADWREINGIKIPFKSTATQGGKPAAEFVVTEFKINTGLKSEDLSKKP